jgi:hypothetical protein
MHLQAAFLFAQEIGKFFCINCLESFKLNNSMTTQNKNFKNIRSGSRNDALLMYNRYKIPKSRETVSLSPVWKVNIFYWLCMPDHLRFTWLGSISTAQRAGLQYLQYIQHSAMMHALCDLLAEVHDYHIKLTVLYLSLGAYNA